MSTETTAELHGRIAALEAVMMDLIWRTAVSENGSAPDELVRCMMINARYNLISITENHRMDGISALTATDSLARLTDSVERHIKRRMRP